MPFFKLDAVQPWVDLIETHSRGYAPCQLATIYKLNLCLDVELLVDCGCSADLILSSREIENLELQDERSKTMSSKFRVYKFLVFSKILAQDFNSSIFDYANIDF